MRATAGFRACARQWVEYARKDYGSTCWGGQTWTLATMNSKGVDPGAIDLPLQIDPQYVVGLNWGRQAQFRVAKNLGSDQFWTALSVENSATIVSRHGADHRRDDDQSEQPRYRHAGNRRQLHHQLLTGRHSQDHGRLRHRPSRSLRARPRLQRPGEHAGNRQELYDARRRLRRRRDDPRHSEISRRPYQRPSRRRRRPVWHLAASRHHLRRGRETHGAARLQRLMSASSRTPTRTTTSTPISAWSMSASAPTSAG